MDRFTVYARLQAKVMNDELLSAAQTFFKWR